MARLRAIEPRFSAKSPLPILQSPKQNDARATSIACILGLTVTAAAEGLGVSRVTLSEVVNGRSGISPEMALRLEAVGWGKAEGWLGMQLDHDLWKAKQAIGKRIKLKRFPQTAPEPA